MSLFPFPTAILAAGVSILRLRSQTAAPLGEQAVLHRSGSIPELPAGQQNKKRRKYRQDRLDQETPASLERQGGCAKT